MVVLFLARHLFDGIRSNEQLRRPLHTSAAAISLDFLISHLAINKYELVFISLPLLLRVAVAMCVCVCTRRERDSTRISTR